MIQVTRYFKKIAHIHRRKNKSVSLYDVCVLEACARVCVNNNTQHSDIIAAGDSVLVFVFFFSLFLSPAFVLEKYFVYFDIFLICSSAKLANV